MKINTAALFLANVVCATAFITGVPKASFAGPLQMATEEEGSTLLDASPDDLVEMDAKGMFPIFPTLEKIQGGKTLRTYKMPIWATKAQMIFTTENRPLKAEAGLWLGPIRQVHTLKLDMENGAETPYQQTLTFKALGPVLKITTNDTYEYPMLTGVYVPTPERGDKLQANTEDVFMNASQDEKLRIQGGDVNGGKGSVRYWQIPPSCKSVQLVSWSRDVGKKSFKLKIEVLQGPNNIKQAIFLQCGGGTQPYHSVIQTPYPGCVIRITNQKFIEDGLVQVAITPYEVEGGGDEKIRTF